MSAPRRIRVLVVDDHLLFRKAMASLLGAEADFAVVGEAGTGQEALQQAMAVRPDIILMDIVMPAMDGLEATRRIKAVLPDARIVMLTISDSDEHLFAAIQAGAQGYLLKDIDAHTFFHTVRAVARGEAFLTGPMAAKVFQEFARHGPRRAAPDGPLSPREWQVLALVAQGMPNKEIAATLSLAVHTVKAHLRHILDKLQVENRVQAAAYVLSSRRPPDRPRLGYPLAPSESPHSTPPQ